MKALFSWFLKVLSELRQNSRCFQLLEARILTPDENVIQKLLEEGREDANRFYKSSEITPEKMKSLRMATEAAVATKLLNKDYFAAK